MQLPVPDEVSDEVVREELISWRTEESGRVCFLSLIVGDQNTIRETVCGLDAVHRVEFMMIDRETFYVYAEMTATAASSRLWTAFEQPKTVIVPPVVYTDTDTMQLTVIGENAALSRTVEQLPNEIAVSIERISEHRHRNSSIAGRLTHRQLEAVTAAHDCGYYEVPREGTLTEVAKALECSESTASTLLRNAQRALVDAALGH